MGKKFLWLFPTLRPRAVGIYQSELGEESSLSRLSHLYPDGHVPVNLDITDAEFKAKVLKQRTLHDQFKVIGEWVEEHHIEDLNIDHIGPMLETTRKDVNSESAARTVLDELARLRADQEAAERCGLHRTYDSGIERGTRNVSLVNIERIAKGLKTGLPSLLSGCHVLGNLVAHVFSSAFMTPGCTPLKSWGSWDRS